MEGQHTMFVAFDGVVGSHLKNLRLSQNTFGTKSRATFTNKAIFKGIPFIVGERWTARNGGFFRSFLGQKGVDEMLALEKRDRTRPSESTLRATGKSEL